MRKVKFKLLFIFIFSVFIKNAYCLPADVEVFFSPFGGCKKQIVKSINEAKSSLYVEAYILTSYDIFNAFIQAKKRGVKVKIILDNSQKSCQGNKTNELLKNNIETYIYKGKGIQHNKLILIDGNIIISGSYNYTKAAEEKNSENLVVIKSAEIYKIYEKNFLDKIRKCKLLTDCDV